MKLNKVTLRLKSIYRGIETTQEFTCAWTIPQIQGFYKVGQPFGFWNTLESLTIE